MFGASSFFLKQIYVQCSQLQVRLAAVVERGCVSELLDIGVTRWQERHTPDYPIRLGKAFDVSALEDDNSSDGSFFQMENLPGSDTEDHELLGGW